MSYQENLAALVERRIGVVLRFDSTFNPIESLLRKRIATLGLRHPDDYVAMLERRSSEDSEWRQLVGVTTNGQTAFFRDRAQMAVVGDAMVELRQSRARPIEIWSAGCSTGEEVYTVAAIAHQRGVPARVLGTDVDEDALALAAEGRYGAWSLRRFPPAARRGLVDEMGGNHVVRDQLRRDVRFARHNLVADAFPTPRNPSGWDIILCRNVLIYFGSERAKQVLASLAASLAPSGWLFVGPADALRMDVDELVAVQLGGRTVLRRAEDAPRLPLGSIPPPRAQLCSVVDLGTAEDDGPVTFAEATRMMRASRLDDASRVLVSLSRGEADVRVLTTLGNVQLALHRFEQASDAYARARDAAPLLPEVHFFQAMLHKKAGQHAAAADASRRALFLDPAFWPARCVRASALMRMNDADAGRRELARLAATLSSQSPPRPMTELTMSSVEGLDGIIVTVEQGRRLCEHHLGPRPRP